ncbi:hypothetical protein VUR80DRAFT_5298 [Thermomyces stellatus]
MGVSGCRPCVVDQRGSAATRTNNSRSRKRTNGLSRFLVFSVEVEDSEWIDLVGMVPEELPISKAAGTPTDGRKKGKIRGMRWETRNAAGEKDELENNNKGPYYLEGTERMRETRLEADAQKYCSNWDCCCGAEGEGRVWARRHAVPLPSGQVRIWPLIPSIDLPGCFSQCSLAEPVPGGIAACTILRDPALRSPLVTTRVHLSVSSLKGFESIRPKSWSYFVNPAQAEPHESPSSRMSTRPRLNPDASIDVKGTEVTGCTDTVGQRGSTRVLIPRNYAECFG